MLLALLERPVPASWHDELNATFWKAEQMKGQIFEVAKLESEAPAHTVGG